MVTGMCQTLYYTSSTTTLIVSFYMDGRILRPHADREKNYNSYYSHTTVRDIRTPAGPFTVSKSSTVSPIATPPRTKGMAHPGLG